MDCHGCGRAVLCGVRQVRGVHNLGNGVIAVELGCVRGHRLVLLTGRTVCRAGDGVLRLTGRRRQALTSDP